jgi:hypothetical protein
MAEPTGLEPATSDVGALLSGKSLVKCAAAGRKLAPFGFAQEQSWLEVGRLWALWKLILTSESVLLSAGQLTAAHNLSFRDAMIVAAYMEGGGARIYAEDLYQESGADLFKSRSSLAWLMKLEAKARGMLLARATSSGAAIASASTESMPMAASCFVLTSPMPLMAAKDWDEVTTLLPGLDIRAALLLRPER